MQELGEILSKCRQRGLRVYVIGAYSVRAYGYLLRQSFDLDLAVERPYLDGLLAVLRELGFAVGITRLGNVLTIFWEQCQ